MKLFEAVHLFGLLTAIVEMFEDEKVLATSAHEDFIEYSAFASHRFENSVLK